MPHRRKENSSHFAPPTLFVELREARRNQPSMVHEPRARPCALIDTERTLIKPKFYLSAEEVGSTLVDVGLKPIPVGGADRSPTRPPRRSCLRRASRRAGGGQPQRSSNDCGRTRMPQMDKHARGAPRRKRQTGRSAHEGAGAVMERLPPRALACPTQVCRSPRARAPGGWPPSRCAGLPWPADLDDVRQA